VPEIFNEELIISSAMRSPRPFLTQKAKDFMQ
jgi:hypothetical protein